MTVTAADAALERMETDEPFADRVKDAGGPEASLEVLRAEGFDVTAAEVRDALVDRYGDHLTPEQLDGVAGGTPTDDWKLGLQIGSIAGGGIAIGLAAGAAAAV